ncbi:MAG TPA: hypothetical protein VKV02_02485 [Acidobacteriaceae bacterium]|nr:hypothetical protein [Acidobacteriaceae bacterium]
MMRKTWQLAAMILLGSSGVAMRGQITNPNDMVSGPPKPRPARERPHGPSSGSIQWLWQYAQPAPNGNAVALRSDERFASLLAGSFRQPQAFWGKDVPISVVIPRFLSRYGQVNAKSNRYLTVDGCVPSFCAAHGMLWVDLGVGDPLMVFAAVDWTTEGHPTDEKNADYNLWLFPNRQVAADALPLALTEAISDWDARLASAHRGVPHIAHALLVEPDGQPFPLNPTLVGANTLPPQPDTITPKPSDDE